MKNKGTRKVQLTSYEDLFLDSDDRIVQVPLSKLHPFKNHPYRVEDDEKMQETVESVKRNGVMTPAIVRPRMAGGFEMVAGHRRWRACELAGLTEMPAVIRNMDDDTATLVMVDTNIQREDILPSEKARAYKMKYDALKHQGRRGVNTADEVGQEAGDSARTVQRYIRLVELVGELLGHVDTGKIPMMAGEKLSYLRKEEQEWVVRAIGNSGSFPSKTQAERLKMESEAGELTENGVYEVLLRKPACQVKVVIPSRQIRNYFPAEYTMTEIEEVIYSLLEKWREDREKGEEKDEDTSV